MQLLVADDNEINLRVACAYLKALGVHEEDIVTARNGLEAVRACRAAQFDLILMDIQMPEMDGVTATRTIISEKLQQKQNIIALTANVTESANEEYLACGMQKVLHKPLSKAAIQSVLELAVDDSSGVSQSA